MAGIKRMLTAVLPVLLLFSCGDIELKRYIAQLSAAEVAVYVSSASGSDTGLGDINAPLKTIQAGIAKAASFIAAGTSSSVRVNVAEGTYEVTDGTENTAEYTDGDYISMVEGVSLYGGFSADFSDRDSSRYVSKIVDLSETGTDSAAVRAYDGLTDATVIDGFTIQGTESAEITSSNGLDIERASPTVSNNVICGGYAAPGQLSLALDIYDNSSPVIRNNMITGGDTLGSSYGMVISDSSNPVVTGNTVHGGNSNLTYGIVCWETQADIIENTIYGGEGNTTLGIMLLSGCMVTISDNNIDGGVSAETSRGIYNMSDDSVRIIGNTITGGTAQESATGIRNESTGWYTIMNNLVFGGTAGTGFDADGIFCYQAGGNIYNNTIAGGLSDFNSAIVLREESFPRIDNNILLSFAESIGGCCIRAYGGGDDHNNGYAQSIRNNALWDQSGGLDIILYRDYQNLDYDTAAAVNGHSHGHCSANIDGAPLFVDIDGPDDDITTMADNDWHLSASSPAGVRTGGLDGTAEGWSYSSDRDGNARTGSGGTGWSMGAYEQD